MPAPVSALRRLSLALSSASLVLITTCLHAQETGGAPLNGTVNLTGGFSPDPWVVDIVPGGDTAVADLGAGCTGFIHAEQPDLRVEYADAAPDLGIFVYAGIDTTLVVSDPAGNWHCSDDASYLGNSSPGIMLSAPLQGTYEIWVGTYAEAGTGATGKLVLTERDSSQWAGMNLGGGNGTSLIIDGIEFGDDLSTWAGDGECDDPRFAGQGAADTLLETDKYHDASDCAAAWIAGTVRLGREPGGAANDEAGAVLQEPMTLQNAGTLAAGDPMFSEGEYYDSYTFQGQPGQRVTIDLDSTDFDTYLMLESPGGQREFNDDDGGTGHSRIDLELSRSGTYTVYVTSYASGETGAYTVTVNQGQAGGGESAEVSLPPDPGGDIYGVFVGIADYPGDANDLERTDDDARRVRDALFEGAGMAQGRARTLLDADATKASVAAALRGIGTTIGANDTLVIFYSGHGGQHARAGGPNQADPDGMDESLVLYDGELLDDELAAMLAELDAGRILLVLDSCYSGGFAKDVVSAPGRMGLFSSEEDVNSHVAYKFEAGGYLSVFFDDAVRGRFADGDGNRQLTAMELSEYIHERYRVDVRLDGSEQTSSRAGGPASVHQHLVVDRGGISADSVLFSH